MTLVSEENGAPRRRKNDPAGVRGRILDAAFSLFQEQGYTATSVHEIARGARVTAGALHHHFATKKSLGLAVVEERVSQALDGTWLQPLRSGSDAREAVLSLFQSLANELDQQGSVRGCPVNNLALELSFQDAEFRSALAGIFSRWRVVLAHALGSEPEAERLATLLIASYSGAMALAKVEQRGAPLRSCANELGRLLGREGKAPA
ncbi:MAG TPA: TetR/AcrR family transcriptional regulator [Sphingomicrobium sp.]|nr:TetR/AcrR family transcriptional regulator [Sphingomicrobium sp.]